MVGPSQMPHHHPLQSQTLGTPEEALKSNTDCIYFLASPLTCKKGAECEYRHSDIARLNPRDCYYWLNGNCLNPKCAFRHPPLEGMFGPQVAALSGPPLPPSQTTTTTVSSAHSSGKQAVPCIFFQEGFCLKGGMCPFSHGPVHANNSKAPQGPLAATFPEPSTIKKPFSGLQKCSTKPKIVEAYVPPQPTRVPLQVKTPSKTTPVKGEATTERQARPSSGIDDYPPNYRQTSPFANGDFINRTNRIQQVHTPEDYDTLDSKDADEISREPSPGFDVLVDDQLRESDYYQGKDRYDRRLTPVNDYNNNHSVDYEDYDSMADADPDRYYNPHRDDSYDQTRGQYVRDQQRVSSERRRYPRGDSPDRVNGSDLRYRLSTNRKVNTLKSVINHDLDRDGGDKSYRVSSQRDTRHLPASEMVVSDRLRGRIKLPRRSTSPLNGRAYSRGRVQDRIKGRVHEDYDDGGRGFRGSRTREMLYDNNVKFSGPKSFSELRDRKGYESNKQTLPIGKRKYSERHEQAQNDVSFEGPKPLSEILKRKRGGNNNEEDSKGGFNGDKELGEDSKPTDGQILQMKGDLIVDDDVNDHEHEEAFVEGEGEYDYEQVDGEEYIEDEAENARDEDFVEDDDGDDFAKKIGVMFS